jgi:hypothetical protein
VLLNRSCSNQGKQKKSNDQRTNIKDSSLKLIKLLRYLINEDKKQARTLYKSFNSLKKVVFMRFYQLVIIFKGHLFSKRLNEEKISHINMLQYYKEYKTQEYDEQVSIHVVSSEYIKDYLQLIVPFYTRGADYIRNHRDHILDSVRNDLVSWSDFNPFKITLP